MKNLKPEKAPCYFCTEETGESPNCHAGCEKYKDFLKQLEADKKAKHDFDRNHLSFMTEAEKNRTIKNQTKYNSHGMRRK